MGRSATFAISLLLAGCAGTSSGQRDSGEFVGPFDQLTQSDLEVIPSFTVLDAIRQYRPRWLRGRGPSITVDPSTRALVTERGETRVRAFVDGIARDLELLDLLSVQDVAVIRFINAAEATRRYGIGHAAGAILVTTRTQ